MITQAKERGWKDRLIGALGSAVRFDESLAPRVAFRIGGPAEALVSPASEDGLRTTLLIAKEEEVPITLLGSGSNVLIGDRGIPGITLRLRGELEDVHVAWLDGADLDRPVEVEVGAGALNAQLVAVALRLGLVGIEFLATIPGTFGGALIMNAGAHGGEIAPYVREVRILNRALERIVKTREECGFAYRKSGFAPGDVLLGATLDLSRGEALEARQRLKKMREHRKRTQPIGQPNAGSIFKNPPGDYAGRMIEACGLKGRQLGGACISELHANFIVNTGAARASDVVALAGVAQRAVADRFGVELEWEVRRLGNFEPQGPSC